MLSWLISHMRDWLNVEGIPSNQFSRKMISLTKKIAKLVTQKYILRYSQASQIHIKWIHRLRTTTFWQILPPMQSDRLVGCCKIGPAASELIQFASSHCAIWNISPHFHARILLRFFHSKTKLSARRKGKSRNNLSVVALFFRCRIKRAGQRSAKKGVWKSFLVQWNNILFSIHPFIVVLQGT